MKTQRLLAVRAAVLLLSAVFLLAAGGCGTTSEPPLSPLDLNPYTITFTTEPAPPVSGKPVVLSVGVTGKDPVPKRADISFDIKKTGQDERVEVVAERKDEGVYAGSYTFADPGKYSVTVHVITRAVHQVSNKEVEVQ